MTGEFMNLDLTIIGYIRSEITDTHSAPKMEDEPGAIQARLELDPKYLDALNSMKPGSELELFTWLHKADRSVLMVHPRGNTSRQKRGVFTTRSPDRPNPIGLHRVTVVAIEKPATLIVHPLEAIDGTPIIDIKPKPRQAKSIRSNN
jgi:L-fuculose-phosphate aldolase